MPECVTPGRLMEYLKSRNPDLSPRFDSVPSEYMRLGETLGVRWDFAFYQMILETGALKYRNGSRSGDVKPTQNNFAGLGATGGGEPAKASRTSRPACAPTSSTCCSIPARSSRTRWRIARARCRSGAY